jgi:hypothetical protein
LAPSFVSSVVLFAAGGYAWHAGFAPRLLGLSDVNDRLKTAPHLSIAVLPFKNLSNDPSQDRLADSLAMVQRSEARHI